MTHFRAEGQDVKAAGRHNAKRLSLFALEFLEKRFAHWRFPGLPLEHHFEASQFARIVFVLEEQVLQDLEPGRVPADRSRFETLDGVLGLLESYAATLGAPDQDTIRLLTVSLESFLYKFAARLGLAKSDGFYEGDLNNAVQKLISSGLYPSCELLTGQQKSAEPHCWTEEKAAVRALEAAWYWRNTGAHQCKSLPHDVAEIFVAVLLILVGHTLSRLSAELGIDAATPLPERAHRREPASVRRAWWSGPPEPGRVAVVVTHPRGEVSHGLGLGRRFVEPSWSRLEARLAEALGLDQPAEPDASMLQLIGWPHEALSGPAWDQLVAAASTSGRRVEVLVPFPRAVSFHRPRLSWRMAGSGPGADLPVHPGVLPGLDRAPYVLLARCDGPDALRAAFVSAEDSLEASLRGSRFGVRQLPPRIWVQACPPFFDRPPHHVSHLLRGLHAADAPLESLLLDHTGVEAPHLLGVIVQLDVETSAPVMAAWLAACARLSVAVAIWSSDAEGLSTLRGALGECDLSAALVEAQLRLPASEAGPSGDGAPALLAALGLGPAAPQGGPSDPFEVDPDALIYAWLSCCYETAKGQTRTSECLEGDASLRGVLRDSVRTAQARTGRPDDVLMGRILAGQLDRAHASVLRVVHGRNAKAYPGFCRLLELVLPNQLRVALSIVRGAGDETSAQVALLALVSLRDPERHGWVEELVVGLTETSARFVLPGALVQADGDGRETLVLALIRAVLRDRGPVAVFREVVSNRRVRRGDPRLDLLERLEAEHGPDTAKLFEKDVKQQLELGLLGTRLLTEHLRRRLQHAGAGANRLPLELAPTWQWWVIEAESPPAWLMEAVLEGGVETRAVLGLLEPSERSESFRDPGLVAEAKRGLRL